MKPKAWNSRSIRRRSVFWVMATITLLIVGCSSGGGGGDDGGDDSTVETVWYQDADGDGYSNGTTLTAAERPSGYSEATALTSTSGDCNDADATVNPGATDICGDGIDQDCDGADAVCETMLYYKDADGDGYSDGTTVSAASPPTGYFESGALAATSGDCDDADPSVHPDATEICDDGKDNDCNLSMDCDDSACAADAACEASSERSYPVVDTGQALCYDESSPTTCPEPGDAFYGQDVQHTGNAPSYTDNGDGTVTDTVTGLMWQQSPDTDGDGDIDADDKMTYDAAAAGASAFTLAGYTDWRLPTIKELYSLIDFNGLDPSGYGGTDTSGLVPFIDTGYFDFGYGDTSAGERIIDAQFASLTQYVSTTMNGAETMFGVNFADGRIKGYGLTMPGGGGEKTFYVLYVRGNAAYGQNDFQNNGDGTVTDSATGLMWTQADSGDGLNWQEALAWVAEKNAADYLGYNDWRLPDVKELQSIVDYTRSPDTTGSAAIDPVFSVTDITNEAGQADFPYFWSGTTHANWSQDSGGNGAYVAFGRAMGFMNGTWMDVHGAGAQRSDPKIGDPADWPTGHGPQGDAIRIYNYVRLVRNLN